MSANAHDHDHTDPPGSKRYDWDLAAALLARGSGVGYAARTVGCHRTTVWRALQRSEAFRRRIAELRADYVTEAAAPLDRLRGEVVAGIRQEVALGNVRVLLWLADRLGLAAPDYLGLGALNAVPGTASPTGHAAAAAGRARRADGSPCGTGDDAPPPDSFGTPLRCGSWPEPAATPAEAQPPGEDAPAGPADAPAVMAQPPAAGSALPADPVLAAAPDSSAPAADPALPPGPVSAPPSAEPAPDGGADRPAPGPAGAPADPAPADRPDAPHLDAALPIAIPPRDGTPGAPAGQPTLAQALAEVRALLATERPALRARAHAAARAGLRDAPPAGPVADAAPRRNGKRFQPFAAQHAGCAEDAAPGMR